MKLNFTTFQMNRIRRVFGIHWTRRTPRTRRSQQIKLSSECNLSNSFWLDTFTNTYIHIIHAYTTHDTCFKINFQVLQSATHATLACYESQVDTYVSCVPKKKKNRHPKIADKRPERFSAEFFSLKNILFTVDLVNISRVAFRRDDSSGPGIWPMSCSRMNEESARGHFRNWPNELCRPK